jgi:hypothetical protein
VSTANRAVRLLVRVSSRQPARAVLSTLSTLLVLAALGPLSGCSGSSEQLVVGQFFTASRLRDNTSLDNIATVMFDPRTHGTVAAFSIVNISPERQTPLPLKALAQAQEDAKAEEAAFSKRKDEYQNANLEAIERVIHAEREGGQGAGTAGTAGSAGSAGSDVKSVKNVKNPKDAEVQTAWTKWREESSAMSKKVADTRRALKSQTALADTSINGGRTAIDVTRSDGTLVTKDVTVSAPVRLPDGSTAQKTLVITLQRAILNGDKPVVGRWVVTGFKDAA